jgi:methyl-accepting chemotaxis protein
MKKINIVQEIADHVIWNVRLRCFLDGGECIAREQVISHKQCSLGIWLHTVGMIKYGEIPEMQELERVHEEIHNAVKRIIQMKRARDIYSAEAELKKLRLISGKIISLLNGVEGKIKVIKEIT